jgi:hypothetical protein
MDPSTEQLIRDYLNRVAVTARRSMGQDEIVAFIARLHASIERQCIAHGVASPADVASVLAALGGPEALVNLEHARLANPEIRRHRAGPEAGTAATDPMAAVSPAPAAASGSGGKDASGGPAAGAALGGLAGRLLRLPRPRRLGRPRDGQPAAPAGPGTGARPEPELTAAQLAAARRSVISRRRPAAIMTDKEAARAARAARRGPQGRDSPILAPLKQNRAAWQGQAADPGQGPAGPSGATEPPVTALAFIPQPAPSPERPTARPKFYPVREPDPPGTGGESGPPVPPARPAGRGPGRTAGSSPELAAGPGPAVFRPRQEPGQQPGTFRPPRTSGPQPVNGQPRTPGPQRTSGPEPAYQPEQKYRSEHRDQPDQVYRPKRKYQSGLPSGSEPATYSKPAFRSWPEQEVDPAAVPASTALVPVVVDVPPSRKESAAAGLRRILKRAATLARRNPLEATAVVLLGLGGLIYPPIWLVGVLVALPSRRWDIRDKWLGLAVPAVVTIVGSAGLAVGVRHLTAGAYLHGAVMIGGYLIRAGAVLGAIYLAWRVQRGQRAGAPPWRRPYL